MLALLLLGIQCGALSAVGAEPPASAKLIPDKNWKQSVRGLYWNTGLKGKERWGAQGQLEIEANKRGSAISAKGKLSGAFTRPAWKLLINHKEVARASNGEFTLRIDVIGPKSFIFVSAVGPKGELEEQRFILDFPGYKPWLEAQKDFFNKRYFLSASGGLSFLFYEEPLTPKLNQLGLTAKLSYTYLLAPPRLDFGFTGYLTAMPLTTSIPGKNARFLGLNVRLGYVLPMVEDPWRLSLMSGVYYTTMIVPDDEFGFSNLMGPQLFPVLRRTLPNGDSISGYFKFSPVGNGIWLETLQNREIAVGLSFTQRTSMWRSISYAVDLADLSLTIDGVSTRSRSASFSVGFSW